jgi:hypothetical protein
MEDSEAAKPQLLLRKGRSTMFSYCGTALRRALGVATAVAALLGVPNLASADETFGLAGVLGIPGAPLTSFDISWVDTSIQLYFLADRNNKSIDVVPIDATPTVFKIVPTGSAAFAGTPGVKSPCFPGAGPNDCAGPNGVITYFNTHTNERELAVGDGPTTNPSCIDGQPFCSTVKVFAGSDAHLVTIVNTFGRGRADELCFDPKDHLILVANDVDQPPYVSFISTDTGKVVNQISFPNATNGIEQCQWSGAQQAFFLNIPEVSGAGDDSSDGAVVKISATGAILATFPVDVTKCAGPQGMALGPDPQILLGCNAPSSINGGTLNGPQNAAIIDATTGLITTVLNDLGGDDEVWFEPVSGHYFLAGGSHLPTQQLGVVDATTTGGPAVDLQAIPQGTQLGQFPTSTGNPVNQQAIFVGFVGTTTRRSHSTAAWGGNISGAGNLTVAFLPVAANGGTPVPSSSLLCNPVFNSGCIAIFTSGQTTEEATE